jgi:pantoate--beta-alanine ligase
MQVVDSILKLRERRRDLVDPVGLVPTMGALHEGHLDLIETARSENNSIIVTIFVNPTQFGPREDLSNYPRNLSHDLELLQGTGTDLVFTPTPDDMYPDGFQTWVEATKVSRGLEGEWRPGHFRGVATVVAKLFNLALPQRAYFGQKDAQQVAVIKRMVRDLNFPLDIVVCPTVREPDGLAKSSRNVYLTHEQRQAAKIIYQGLKAAAEDYQAGERRPEALRGKVYQKIQTEPLASVEYVSVGDAKSLQEINDRIVNPILVSLAVKIGNIRLIDNLILPEPSSRHELSQLLG